MPGPNWVREYGDGEIVPGTPYRVIRLMGAGGMGSVYEVEHVELGRRYVLKSLLRTLAARQDLIARMRNEWRALGQLEHRNIVDVVNAGASTSGVPFYVMELLVGETLRDRLLREVRLPSSEAARIAQGVLLGLHAAHEIGIIHRDVKPANVFLTREKLVKVLDFGVAQVNEYAGPKITAKGLAIGTPRYMSPEQALGESADARSDVYAVGLLLYEMIVGEGPFDDVTEQNAQMQAHLSRLPPKLHEKLSVPLGLSEIVARALDKEPAERFTSARDMASALSPYATMQSIRPSIPTPAPARTSRPPEPPRSRPPPVESPRSRPPPPVLDGTLPPLVTRGTLIGASIVAAAIVAGAIYFIQHVPDAEEESTPSAGELRPARPRESESANTLTPAAAKASASSEAISPAAAPSRATADSGSRMSADDAAARATLPDDRLPKRPSNPKPQLSQPEPERLPPSGL